MALYGAQYSAYGAMPQQLEAGLPQLGKPLTKQCTPKQRMRMSMKAICTCLFVPWILFSILYAVVTFSIHYSNPILCWGIVALGVLIVTSVGGVAYQKAQESQANWFFFLFVCCALAVSSGPMLGDINFWTNMQPYYDLETLNTYDSVNPSKSRGEQMMDAGKVTFVTGASVDHGKAFQFQDLDTYCVAPISIGTGALKSYDFWAIGLNCCGWNTTKQFEYTCGPQKSSTARQGLRLMNRNQQDFYRLAVQQAEAQYRIVANHPLLFYWTEDAQTDMLSYWDYGFKYFECGIGAFFCVQIFLILVATILFSKLEF